MYHSDDPASVSEDAAPAGNRTIYLPETSEHLSAAHPAGHFQAARTKRKQVKNACVNCQKACKKCDDARPCSRCVKYKLTDSCRDSPRKERRNGLRKTRSSVGVYLSSGSAKRTSSRAIDSGAREQHHSYSSSDELNEAEALRMDSLAALLYVCACYRREAVVAPVSAVISSGATPDGLQLPNALSIADAVAVVDFDKSVSLRLPTPPFSPALLVAKHQAEPAK